MLDIADSFCERCGTRYTLGAAPAQGRLTKARAVARGLRTFVLSDSTSMTEAMTIARTDAERETIRLATEEFHRQFNFCMTCRQYTCQSCWNETAAACLTCAPLDGEPAGDGASESTVAASSAEVEPPQPDVRDMPWPAADLPSPTASPAAIEEQAPVEAEAPTEAKSPEAEAPTEAEAPVAAEEERSTPALEVAPPEEVIAAEVAPAPQPVPVPQEVTAGEAAPRPGPAAEAETAGQLAPPDVESAVASEEPDDLGLTAEELAIVSAQLERLARRRGRRGSGRRPKPVVEGKHEPRGGREPGPAVPPPPVAAETPFAGQLVAAIPAPQPEQELAAVESAEAAERESGAERELAGRPKPLFARLFGRREKPAPDVPAPDVETAPGAGVAAAPSLPGSGTAMEAEASLDAAQPVEPEPEATPAQEQTEQPAAAAATGAVEIVAEPAVAAEPEPSPAPPQDAPGAPILAQPEPRPAAPIAAPPEPQSIVAAEPAGVVEPATAPAAADLAAETPHPEFERPAPVPSPVMPPVAGAPTAPKPLPQPQRPGAAPWPPLSSPPARPTPPSVGRPAPTLWPPAGAPKWPLGTAEVWAESAREVSDRGGARACGQCALPLSPQARFCRRCGTPQA